MMQNLSGLTEESDEENDRSTEQKCWYDGRLTKLKTSEVKRREVEAMLAQMHSEHEIERQHWDAERSAECAWWENDNHLWDEMCAKLKAQHQHGA